MKPKGILFKAEMVRAILAGTKTQTRRLFKPAFPSNQAVADLGGVGPSFFLSGKDQWSPAGSIWAFRQLMGLPAGTALGPYRTPCPVGQILYVKETWRTRREWDSLAPYQLPCKDEFYDLYIDYAAGLNEGYTRLHGKTRISIHMPKWAARIWLEVTDVRVQRLQDISEEDAIAEGLTEWENMWGIPTDPQARWSRCPVTAYSILWEMVNSPGSWDANPWVFAYTFKRVERPV